MVTKTASPAKAAVDRRRDVWKIIASAAAFVAAVVALVGLVNSIFASNKAKGREADRLLDDAWNQMGGTLGPISEELEQVPTETELGRLETARRKVAEALELVPSAARAWAYKGIIEAKKGRFEVALSDLQRAKKLDSSYPKPYYAASAILFQQKKFCEAAREAQLAISLAKGEPQPFLNLSRALEQIGNLDAATEKADEATKTDPSFAPAWERLGYCYHLKEDYDRAFSAYLQWHKLRPRDPLALYNLAEASRVSNRMGEAIKYYKEALDRDPNISRVYPVLALSLFETGDAKAAHECLKVALERFPEDQGVYLVRGMLLHREGDSGGAIKALKKAVDLDPEDLLAWKMLALSLEQKYEPKESS